VGNTGGFSDRSTLAGFSSPTVKGRILAEQPTPSRRSLSSGLKPKDLCLIPARVALAAQADGWWVRSMIIWAKPNPMPESVTDRPTDAYEHIIMLTKSERYYWDQDAVREPHVRIWNESNGGSFAHPVSTEEHGQSGYAHSGPQSMPHPGGRNIRNVWTFATQPYAGAHFATFPEELPRRCILAATSERGACAQCSAPWCRVVGKEKGEPPSYNGSRFDRGKTKAAQDQLSVTGEGERTMSVETIGWQPGCLCRGQRGRTVPCVVLDPFGGSGTTGRVAVQLNRRAVLLDVAYSIEAYGKLASKRTVEVQRSLLHGCVG
jgi:DNA methylase